MCEKKAGKVSSRLIAFVSPRNGLDSLDLSCTFRSFSQERSNPRLQITKYLDLRLMKRKIRNKSALPDNNDDDDDEDDGEEREKKRDGRGRGA